MKIRRAAVALTAVAAIAATPATIAFAAAPATAHPPKVKARFAITKLATLPPRHNDVKSTAVTVRLMVQVKDFDKKFNPSSVTIQVNDKVTGTATTNTNITVKTRQVGKSKVVTNWQGSLTIAKGSVPAGATAIYCVSLVKVDPNSTAVLPVVATAKGLAGRDCFTIVNSAKP